MSASIETIDGTRVLVLREPATGSEAHVVAEVGSNLARFRTRVGGREVQVLAEAPDMATLRERPTRWGSAPLFPYPGRIEAGRFEFHGRTIELPKAPDGNAIHGVLRARPFEIVSTGDSQAVTQLDSEKAGVPTADWPWPFVFTQTTSLRDGKLRVDIDVRNAGDADMPMGLGFHPYFPASPEHRVWVDADERWEQRAPGLPTGEVEPETELRSPRALRDIPPTIQMAEGSVRNLLFRRREGGISAGVQDLVAGYETRLTTSDGFDALVLFTPVAPPLVSLEPHTCVPNAFNFPNGGTIVLKSGGSWTGWYQLEARAL